MTRGAVFGDRIALADSFWSRFRGLMGRAELPPGEGVWLSRTGSIHMLFMRFPIDCVFVARPDTEGRRAVVGVRRALPPWRGLVPHVRGADGVLELPVGTIDRTRTVVGDLVLLAAPSA